MFQKWFILNQLNKYLLNKYLSDELLSSNQVKVSKIVSHQIPNRYLKTKTIKAFFSVLITTFVPYIC